VRIPVPPVPTAVSNRVDDRYRAGTPATGVPGYVTGRWSFTARGGPEAPTMGAPVGMGAPTDMGGGIAPAPGTTGQGGTPTGGPVATRGGPGDGRSTVAGVPTGRDYFTTTTTTTGRRGQGDRDGRH
jgi:hypothetical protein